VIRGAAHALWVAVLGGCSLLTDSFVTNDFSGDPYPIQVDTTTGAVLIGVREGGAADRVGILDALSPITLVDPGLDATPLIESRSLTLLGMRSTGTLDLPRAQLVDARVLRLHPCDDLACKIGTAGIERTYEAIIGADALAGDALRLRVGDSRVSILADVAGGEIERGEQCDAVYSSPYRGGGTLVVAGTELGFSGRRITMPTCLGANPDPEIPQSQRGTDALMLISTAIGPSLLGESAYARYRIVNPTMPDLTALPAGTVFLASGPVDGKLASIPNIALVARSGSTPRAPCRHVYAHHLLLERNCVVGDDCPCEDDGSGGFCALPAFVELTPQAGVPMLVVPDDNPTLQALRAELRPNQAEVDGILGTSALGAVEMDVDYPHDRVLARCTTADCTMRVALPDTDDRARVQRCLDVKF
jgi:hypothetical protein